MNGECLWLSAERRVSRMCSDMHVRHSIAADTQPSGLEPECAVRCPCNPTVAYSITSHFFFQAEDGIRDGRVTGVQTCALPIWGIRPELSPHQRRNCHSQDRFCPRSDLRECRPRNPGLPPQNSVQRAPPLRAWACGT